MIKRALQNQCMCRYMGAHPLLLVCIGLNLLEWATIHLGASFVWVTRHTRRVLRSTVSSGMHIWGRNTSLYTYQCRIFKRVPTLLIGSLVRWFAHGYSFANHLISRNRATLGYTALGYVHWATLPLVWSVALPRQRIVVSPRPHETKRIVCSHAV